MSSDKPVRIPYTESVSKCRGRPKGSKNSLGHCAGRPKAGVVKEYVVKPPKPSPVRVSQAERSPKPRPLGADVARPVKSNGGNGHSPTSPLPVRSPLVMRAVMNANLNEDLPTPESIIKAVGILAFFDARKLPGVPQDISDEAAQAISSYSLNPIIFEGKPVLGPDGKVLCQFRVNTWNKNAAQDQLMKWAGLFSKNNEQSKPNINANLQINQFNKVELSDFSKDELLLAIKLGMAKQTQQCIELVLEDQG